MARWRHNRGVEVALHDVEPETFERCALIRDWLSDHGVERVTLLVGPHAPDQTGGRAAVQLADWLGERRRAGDVVVERAGGGVVPAWRQAGLPRLDIRPADLDRPGRMITLERALRAGRRGAAGERSLIASRGETPPSLRFLV